MLYTLSSTYNMLHIHYFEYPKLGFGVLIKPGNGHDWELASASGSPA